MHPDVTGTSCCGAHLGRPFGRRARAFHLSGAGGMSVATHGARHLVHALRGAWHLLLPAHRCMPCPVGTTPAHGVCPRLAGCTAAKSPDRLRLRLGSTCLARSALRQSAQSACGGRSAHMRRRGRPASIASCFSSAWPLHAVPGEPSACHNLQALQLAVEPC